MQWDIGQTDSAGEAKQHAQIAHTEVTLSGPSMSRSNNTLFLLTCDELTGRLSELLLSAGARAGERIKTKDLGESISCSSPWRETLLANWKGRTENELLSTFTPCVDAGVGSNLSKRQNKAHSETFLGLSSVLDMEQNDLNTAKKSMTVIHFTIRHVTLLPEILYSGDSLVLLASHKRYYQINTVELLL